MKMDRLTKGARRASVTRMSDGFVLQGRSRQQISIAGQQTY